MRGFRQRVVATVLLLLTGLVIVPSPVALAQSPTPPPAPVEPMVWRGIDPGGMDLAAGPGDDLFRYANGKWFERASIPSDRTIWGITEVMEEENYTLLHTLLEDAARDTSTSRPGVVRKVGDLYASGMDTARIEKEGLGAIAPELALINGIHDVPGLQDALAQLHREAIFPAFWSGVQPDPKDSEQMIFWLGEGGLGLPDRDYYLEEDEKSQKIRRQYVAHITQMFVLKGDSAEQAQTEARTVMTMETRLARASLDKVVRRDPYATYHILTLKEINALTPGLSWQQYLGAVGLKKSCPINVSSPAFLREFGQMVTTLPLEDWKIYLRWHLLHASAYALSTPFANENFHFNQTILRGVEEMEPRWKQVLHVVDENLGEALGQLYVARVFPAEAKNAAHALVDNLKAALRERLKTLEWMSESTRLQAQLKLDALNVKVGYPDKWRDYSNLVIDRGSYFANLRRAAQFEYQRDLDKIGKPRDRSEWDMTPPTINAYYSPDLNEIVFPAGELRPPNFDVEADDAVNYGNAGATIGHEITHAFDDQGRKYDAHGNLKDWWTADDAKNFQARAALIEKQYNAYVAIDNLHVNGALTLGENIADIGGLKIAWLAFQKALQGKPRPPLINGMTPEQRFFVAFAQSWREKRRPESLRLQIATNEHAPEQFRVLGPVSLMPEFYTAFGLPIPEWVAARQKEAIW